MDDEFLYVMEDVGAALFLRPSEMKHIQDTVQFANHAIHPPTTHLGIFARTGPLVDPSDQLDAPASREVGGHGVSVKEL